MLWWHRDAPLDEEWGSDAGGDAVESALHDGGRLLLSLRGMAAVDAFGVDDVPPNDVGTGSITEPTGVLWKAIHDDHPAVEAFDSLRVPICEHGAVPYARYEGQLPNRGEVLASTVRGEHDLPNQVSVVSWEVGTDGAVIGVGAPLAFDEPTSDHVAHRRDAFAAGLVNALADDGTDHPSRPLDRDDLRTVRRELSDDLRPSAHLTPPANWLNDPNGVVEWNGRYHVFYQYNPGGPFHDAIHWGHAVSDDLVRWEDEPVALTPSPDGPDRDGCWSGCAIDDDGVATILYTGGRDRAQLPCLATADDDDLRTWRKHHDNPIIDEPPSDLDVLETDHWEAEFRDHNVWFEDERWHQVIGTGVTDVGGAVLLYTSEDLRDWRYEGPVLVGESETSGTVWECPEILDLGDADLLHVSNYEDVRYFLGTFADGSFHVDREGLLDHGDFYAPQSMDDGDRYLTWGWLTEARDVSAQWDAGWSGAMSLPRVLDLGSDGRLRQRPAEEVRELRARRLDVPDQLDLDSGDCTDLDVGGGSLELDLTIRLDDADSVSLTVLEAPDGEERTPIRYTRDGRLVLDRTASSVDHRASTDSLEMRVPPYDEPLSLRAFVDGSVVELYANERHCMTGRVYPTRSDSTGVSLSAQGGSATVSSLAGWELGSIWAATDTAAEPTAPRR
ncbi:glycoside hydrolase family 32 protein [Haloarculaceae archaeon H-GB11]|nr:glycoside hydrolase family 32 protein [Haloarculaceae archaeon H-GB11]